nr:uncharacterized protein LOC109152077 [Ipomoea trifida]
MQPHGIRTTQNASNRGRGGKITIPRKAAAQQEHTVVRGSTKERVVTRTTVHQRRSESYFLSTTTKIPHASRTLIDEGGDFFDCDTPKEPMEEDDRMNNHPVANTTLEELN